MTGNRLSGHMSAWAEIDRMAVRHNAAVLREQVREGCRICAVLKGDAYGHNLQLMRDFLIREKLADMIAVGRLGELLQVFRDGKDPGADVLLLGEAEVYELEEAIRQGRILLNRAIFSIFSMRQFREFRFLAQQLHVRIRVHIRVDNWDSGMGLGFKEFLQVEETLFSTSSIEVCGVYGHLYSSYYDDHGATRKDLERFDAFVREIREEHRRRILVHVENSALIFSEPEYCYDMIRPGAAFYGLPSGDGGRLKVCMRICARIFSIMELPLFVPLAYHPAGEGPVPITKEPESPAERKKAVRRIARIMIGYGDCPLLLTLKDVRVSIGGRLFPLAEEVCMDNLCVDVSGAENVRIGDTAVLLGAEGVLLEEIMDRNSLALVHSDFLTLTGSRLEKILN